jgi:N-acetyl-beta-hexosaminidase
MPTKNILGTLAVAAAECALAGSLPAHAAEFWPGEEGIVPQPAKVELGTGGFLLSSQCKMFYQKGSPGAQAAAEYLSDTWGRILGRPAPAKKTPEVSRGFMFLTTAGAPAFLGQEGYRLDVTPEGLTICAPQPAGLFYGVQTLRQLLSPVTFGYPQVIRRMPFSIPCGHIEDYPRFAWRGMHLDVPEIDVPAHSRAAIVAYPELLCTGDPYQFKSAQDVRANVLCPSQELTYEFLEGVFGELADLFPGPYIHVGGDERPAGPWEQCDRCRKRMQDEHLADGRFLQDRFLKRLQGFLRTRGKAMVGWDELEQESLLDKDYVVMAWQSVEAGLAAARKGYPVVMAPSPFTYFDLSYNQDPAEPGLRWAGVISLEKAYSFDPKPATLPPAVAERILGVEGCLWSETLVTPDRPDYMAYPRVCALAEIAWTPQSQRSWPDFWARLWQKHLTRLDEAGIAYRIPPPTAQQSGSRVTILLPYPGGEVRYTLDGSEPGPRSTRYTEPFDLPQNAVLKMRTFRPNGRGSQTTTGVRPMPPGA